MTETLLDKIKEAIMTYDVGPALPPSSAFHVYTWVEMNLVPVETFHNKMDAIVRARDLNAAAVLDVLARELIVGLESPPTFRAALAGERKPQTAFEPPVFQERVRPWMDACFGAEISSDINERNHRFLEEALELVQAKGCTRSEAHQLVDYVYGRDQGDVNQEVGGVMVTLAALCLASGIDMHQAGEMELARVWNKIDKIRAKQAAKPKHSPLPE